MVTTGTPGTGRELPCSALRLTHQERAWAAYFLKRKTLSGRTGPEIQFAMKKKNQERESDSWELVEAAEASRSGVQGSERHARAGVPRVQSAPRAAPWAETRAGADREGSSQTCENDNSAQRLTVPRNKLPFICTERQN